MCPVHPSVYVRPSVTSHVRPPSVTSDGHTSGSAKVVSEGLLNRFKMPLNKDELQEQKKKT